MAEPGELLERLRVLRGIGRDFTDYQGRTRALSEDSLRKLLAALGHRVDDAAALHREADEFEARDWRRVLGPVAVLRAGQPLSFSLPVSQAPPRLRWHIEPEHGETLHGEFDPATLPVLGERAFGEAGYRRLQFALPPLAPGYHCLSLAGLDDRPLGSTVLIIAPERCYQPEAIRDGGRLWGPSVQLYTLRSARNWGIGDFTDLAGFAAAAAELGADLVGLNPLHALFPADPALSAPYSPSSRYFLNVLYIDPEAIPEFAACPEVLRLTGAPTFQARLEALRVAPFVDYPGVAACKLEALRFCFAYFQANASPERTLDFMRFIKNGGLALERYALFHAIQAKFTAAERHGGWPAWPADYQDPASSAVQSFREAEADAVQFHGWLQWVAATQLAAAERQARKAGMRLGLYHDLAVGPNGGGAETWAERGLYAEGATVGAPPDPLAPQGQDWGIPPFDPEALRERAYAPFVRLLRANMGRDGALRIDHVMLLMRLWWVPRGSRSAEGGYVHYRLDELLAIVALESQRCRCLVIGEDLGTVPPEVRAAMASHGLYSYRVLFFERHDDGRFKHPAEYPRDALVTVSTHDLPTFRGFWSEADIRLRARLGLYPEADQAQHDQAARAQARGALLRALADGGVVPADESAARPPTEAVQLYLARAPAAVLMLQPEDWLEMETPVNVPGTHGEYPNWGRKLAADWPDFMTRESTRRLTAQVSEVRGRDG
jgi:(1->4)-alpha-D-glucan 1-alpha-D-glucosylmutase